MDQINSKQEKVKSSIFFYPKGQLNLWSVVKSGNISNSSKLSIISLLGKKIYVCFLLHLKKNIRVGRSLLFYLHVFIFYFIFHFPDFTKKHNRCAVCTKYITKRCLFFGAIYLQHRMHVLL